MRLIVGSAVVVTWLHRCRYSSGQITDCAVHMIFVYPNSYWICHYVPRSSSGRKLQLSNLLVASHFHKIPLLWYSFFGSSCHWSQVKESWSCTVYTLICYTQDIVTDRGGTKSQLSERYRKKVTALQSQLTRSQKVTLLPLQLEWQVSISNLRQLKSL